MDTVDNDVPGIRVGNERKRMIVQMELFNYVRNSGYERESPFVNDVKFHPVLKAKKSFASGILAAFMSSEPTQPTKQVEQENMENNQE